jgi:hypothetical protein
MKKELNFIEKDGGFTALLKPNGINFTAGFFILFFVSTLAFTIYTFIEYYPSAEISQEGNSFFLMSLILIIIISVVMLFIVINLVGQRQEVYLHEGEIAVLKKNPFWFTTIKKISTNQIERVKREKLIFSIKNIWYAFLFHDHTAFHDDAEKYLVPHLCNSSQSIAFFEFADEGNKDYIVEQIRKSIDK